MNPEELDKQFKKLEGDKQVQAAAAGTPPPAAKKKRITVAELNKTIDQIKDTELPDICNWIGDVDTRLESLEATTAKHNKTLLSDVKTRLDIIESVGLENLPSFISDTTERFQKMEKGIARTQQLDTGGLTMRINTLEGAIGAIADAFRQHLEEISGEQPAAAQEIEFATPPEPPAAGSTRAGDIEAVASVCLTMNDVLLVTRALKDSPDLERTDKNEILNIACRAAGVEVTHGLQIRAGVIGGYV